MLTKKPNKGYINGRKIKENHRIGRPSKPVVMILDLEVRELIENH